MKQLASYLLISIIIIVFVYFLYIEIHGRDAEIEIGKLHDNCEICDMYRTLNMDNQEFQLRELNRKMKNGKD